MIKTVIAFLVIFFSAGRFAFGQVKDSVGVAFSKQQSAEKGYDLYEITIANGRDIPICIMFVPYIKLFYDPPKKMLFDYIVLRNFCYNDFKQAIFRNSSTWYDGYTIKHVIFDLPR
jgi:hypothetical protein